MDKFIVLIGSTGTGKYCHQEIFFITFNGNHRKNYENRKYLKCKKYTKYAFLDHKKWFYEKVKHCQLYITCICSFRINDQIDPRPKRSRSIEGQTLKKNIKINIYF